MRFSQLVLAFPPMLALASYILLLSLVAQQGIRSRLRTFFAIFVLTMVVWSFGSMMMRLDPLRVELWNTVTLAGGTVTMPVALFAFVQTFLGQRRRTTTLVGIGVAIFLAVTTVSGYMVRNLQVAPGGQITFQFGPILPVYGAYWIFFVGNSCYSLVNAYQNTTDPIMRNRILYPLLAMGFVFLGGFTNAWPALSAFPVDHIANLITACLLAYAILRYRLLDISLVIRQGLLYSVPTIIIGATYFLIISLAIGVFEELAGPQLYLVSFIVAILTAVIARPVQNRAQEWIDRLFFRQKYDARVMLQELSGVAASVLEFDELMEILAEEIVSTMQISRLVLFLKMEGDGSMVLMFEKGLGRSVDTTLRDDHPLVEWLSRENQVLARRDMEVIPAFKALWGREREDLERLDAQLFVPLSVKEELVGILALGPKLSGEPFSHNDRLTLTTLANQTAVAIENARLYEAAQQELVERRLAERELRESEARYRLLVENAPLGILSADSEGWITDYNPEFAALLSVPQREVRSINLLEFPPLVAAGISEDVHRCLESGQSIVSETAYSNGQEEERYLRYYLTPIRASDDDIAGVQAITEDITEHRNLETQLMQSQKMEAIGQLAGGVAHDFNNILTVISGYTDFLLDELDTDSPAYGDVQEIQDAGERAASLTNQLLAFSRKQMQELRVLDVNEVIEGMIKMLRRLIGEHISLELGLADDPRPVKADPTQIEQVVINLAVNARDAMPEGGTLTLETRDVELDERQAARYGGEAGRYVVIAVTDTGTGMTPEVMEHIFEPFFTTKEEGRGTGLGLSTVYGIVRQNDGIVHVESEPGRGSSFKIYLPRFEKTTDVEQSTQPEQVLAGHETVLVVEDQQEVRRVIVRMLRQLGYQVLQAEKGTEALELYSTRSETEPIALVVTDIVMPEMSGHELVDRLIQERPNIPVLYISGYTDNVVDDANLTGSSYRLLQKPFTVEKLAHRVRQALGETVR